MMKRCLIKLSISWILNHKERYVLSWISFAIISVFFIFVYSVAGSITSQVKDYISNDFTSNQINIRNVRVADDGVENDLNRSKAEKLAGELGVQGVRALKKNDMLVALVEDKNYSSSSNLSVVSFYTPWGLLLQNDYTKTTNVLGSLSELKRGEVVVNDSFLEKTDLDTKSAIGATIVMDNGESYTIGAIISRLPQGSFLNQYSVFLPDDTMDGFVDYITFDFQDKTNLSPMIKKVESLGYSYSTNTVHAERMNEIASQYVIIGSVISALFTIICIICLVNSLLVTINENAAFMSLFRLLGLTKSNYRFMTCFTSGVQGVIGGVLGILLSFLCSKFAFQLAKSIGLTGLDIVSDFRINGSACLLTMAVCIAVSVLTGWLAYLLSFEKRAEAIADNELL